MNAKELQQQYLNELQNANKPNKPRVGDTLPDGYLNHVSSQAKILSGHLGEEQGIAYIKDALREHPDVMAEVLGEFSELG